ncbi:YebC/PmpR family DNA-binding transcriptional regulator [Insolitispirillum peregrinum]|uniref:Probable transcriptional regulatory protein SAMN05421779_101482 n=1 Tax=Insolitispirillum peregrinum TaxID=80876 RepID=A0A1N7IQG5_9PROT|nr:YebC/PmpR family DNA-binding transcriptional regulator [Insolitispirillum peregrinum]SIS39324.1 DNA-binding regulatory protein, YebC/PmpR family [Insolitispirillum peregrinum]
MAGHSQFKNIMYRKGAQDAKRSKLFTKLAKEITVSVKTGGSDMTSNPRLRAAIAEARKNSMPKDNVDRAIKRALGGDSADNYEEVRYEGMGPGNVSIIVEALTDNRNRTASNVRAAFNKLGGSMTPVTFNYERVGYLAFKAEVGSPDDIFEAAIEAGAADVESDDEAHNIYCSPEDFNDVRAALESKLGEPDTARLDWRPLNRAEVDEEAAKTLFKLLDTLEDDDDVQRVTANFDIPDEIMERLSS